MTFDNEIEKVKAETNLLQSKLEFLEEIEKHKYPEVKNAFKDVYGYYPDVLSLSWIGFQLGWNAAMQNQNNIEEVFDNPTTLPESPTSEFRQKLFDGIKSVFYDPEYERTHWSVKVNMAVDEVLTHFEDILPDKATHYSSSNYDAGWNDCISSIKGEMEIDDD
jgi:hypothetical protein